MSRYNNTEEINFNKIRTKGTYVPQWFLNSSNLEEGQIWEIKMKHRYVGKPYLIAFDFYNDEKLDWAIIHFDKNQIDELFGWPTIENRVFIPAPNVVLSET